MTDVVPPTRHRPPAGRAFSALAVLVAALASISITFFGFLGNVL